MSGGQFFSYLAFGIGVVSFLGAAAAFLRGSADKGTITSLQASVSAMQTENLLKTTRISELEAKVAGLTEQVHVYQDTVTQAKEVANLTAMLSSHHTESMAALKAIKTEINK